jgi:hypothetical protein
MSGRILIARKSGGRAVDELGDDRLALGDLAMLAVLGDDDEFVQRVTQQRLQVLCSGRPASRIAGLTFRETGAGGGLP